MSAAIQELLSFLGIGTKQFWVLFLFPFLVIFQFSYLLPCTTMPASLQAWGSRLRDYYIISYQCDFIFQTISHFCLSRMFFFVQILRPLKDSKSCFWWTIRRHYHWLSFDILDCGMQCMKHPTDHPPTKFL